MDPRQVAITTGQSFNIAAQLLTTSPGYEYRGEQTLGELAVVADGVAKVVLGAQELAEAAATVGNAFPGTQQVAPAAVPQATEPFPANVVQFPQQQVAPAPVAPVAQPYAPVAQQPAPIPGVQDGDPQTAAYWQEFFADPSQWYDNRTSKSNPKAPDFRHKTRKTPDGRYNIGLYVTGKGNPSWVAGQLAARGLA